MTRHRWRVVVVFVVMGTRTSLHAEPVLVLDRAKVIELAMHRAPALPAAEARTQEARAGRTGTDVRAATNPELTITAGPRFLTDSTGLDAMIGLRWPLDFSGAGDVRPRLAEERVQVAQAEQASVTLTAVGDALARWDDLRIAEDQLALARAAAIIDEELVRIATVRRNAGAVGDGDLALANVLRADGKARLKVVQAQRQAALIELRAQLGLADDADVTVPALDDGVALPPVAQLLERVGRHPEIARAAHEVAVANEDAELQRRIGKPVPRLVLEGEHSPEYAVHGGIDIPLPIYQRNQTSRAVADAHVGVTRAEQSRIQRRLVLDLRVQYEHLLGARDASAALAAVSADVADAERLATRGYELGQTTLGAAVAARREAATARQALLDARADVARQQLALDLATGTLL